MKYVLSILCIYFSCCQMSAAREPVVLTTHDLEPYGYYNDGGDLVGSAVDVVRCVFKKMDRPFTIKVVPWKRAQRLVQDGVADGFFAASRNKARDFYADITDTIAEQKWVWYYLTGSILKPTSPDFKERARVSSFLGANMHKWLEDNEYNTYNNAPPANTELLLKVLLSGRLDAALANDQVMSELIGTFGLQNRIDSHVLKNKPLGVYFSERFLEQNSGFLGQFNGHVSSCRDL